MGLKMLYQGTIIDVDKIATRDPTLGTRKFNIKVNNTSTAKYGLTSDTSASQYCNFNAILDNKKVYFGTESSYIFTSYDPNDSDNPTKTITFDPTKATKRAISLSTYTKEYTSTIHYSTAQMSQRLSIVIHQSLANEIFAICASSKFGAKAVDYNYITTVTYNSCFHTVLTTVVSASTAGSVTSELANSAVKIPDDYIRRGHLFAFRASTATLGTAASTTLANTATNNQGYWEMDRKTTSVLSSTVALTSKFTNYNTFTNYILPLYTSYKTTQTSQACIQLKYSNSHSSHRYYMMGVTNTYTTNESRLESTPIVGGTMASTVATTINYYTSAARSAGYAAVINYWGTDTNTVSLKFTGRAARTYRFWSSLHMYTSVSMTNGVWNITGYQLDDYVLSYYTLTHTNTISSITEGNINM